MPRSSAEVFGSRLAVAVTSVIVTTVVVAGGIAVASVPNNSVTTAKIRNGAVTSAKIRDKTIRSVDLHPSVLPRFAHVNAGVIGSTLINGRGVSNVGRVAVGQYTVTFAASVASCGLIATLTDNATGTSSNGEISAERDNNNTVRVRTYNSAGTPEDTLSTDGFTLMLAC